MQADDNQEALVTNTIIRKPYIVSEENFAELSQLFRNAWSSANGAEVAKVKVLVGEDSFSIFIQNALNKAERLLAAQDAGRSRMRRYMRGLIEVLYADQRSQIRRLTCEDFHLLGVDVNFDKEYIMCNFQSVQRPDDWQDESCQEE
jgi:uncharacterized protein YbcI